MIKMHLLPEPKFEFRFTTRDTRRREADKTRSYPIAGWSTFNEPMLLDMKTGELRASSDVQARFENYGWQILRTWVTPFEVESWAEEQEPMGQGLA